jgi:hypothetical protein
MNRGWSIPDVYRTRAGDIDTCPECGGPKTKHGLMCIACRRRVGRRSRWGDHTLAERFWSKVDRRGPDECWVWTGAVDAHGYGRINVDGKSTKVGRVSLVLSGVEVPTGLGALHTCDNPPCVNPAHLYAGTQRDNARDAIERGRFRLPHRRTA